MRSRRAAKGSVMPQIEDPFDFFRYLLGTIVTVYSLIVMAQSLWTWYVWLAGTDRYITVMRRYIILHGLRLRFRTFWGDVIITILLCLIFCVLFQAHRVIYQIEGTLRAADHAPAMHNPTHQ